MNQKDFDQFFSILKPIVDSGRSDDFFKRHPLEELDLSQDQAVRLLKYLNAHKLASLCAKCFGFPMDYTPESLLYLDVAVSSLCALDLDDTQLTRLLYREPDMPRDWADPALQLLLAYTIKTRRQTRKTDREDLDPAQLFSQTDDSVIAELIADINAYLCETFLNCYGGGWVCDAVKDGHVDALGVQAKNGDYLSFIDAVYRRFYEDPTPLAYLFCAVCGLDYAALPAMLSGDAGPAESNDVSVTF